MSVWYEDGLRFACRSCGKCCIDHGAYAHVFLHEGDEKRLARALGMPVQDFLDAYTVDVDGFVTLANAGDRCIFLEDTKCRVWRARPLQCSTWPFWPENLNRRVWKSEIRPSCPGIGKGRLYTAEEIERIAFRARQAVPLMHPEDAG
jgi:Fe-S-cluster containining protein